MSEQKEINIQKHALVPKHIKLTEEEKQKLLDQYNISITQLPSILDGDAALKGIEVSPGDVIKIVRSSPTASEFFFYRVVVHG